MENENKTPEEEKDKDKKSEAPEETPQAETAAETSSEIAAYKIKRPVSMIQVWRGLRDLNSRAGFPTYSLSRDRDISIIVYRLYFHTAVTNGRIAEKIIRCYSEIISDF